MAVEAVGTAGGSAASGRRITIGANVVVAVALAAALVVLVNYFASMKHFRDDVASYGNYGLSERTKSIVRSYPGEIELSVLYVPKDDDDNKQQSYLSRLQDYCDELTRFAPNVKVAYVSTDSQREKLVSRISSTFGAEADKHKAALASYEKVSTELHADLTAKLHEAQVLMQGETWLGVFPIFANIVATMKADVETLNKTGEAIKELTPAGGIPKYGEATTKAKTGITEIKGHLQAIAKRMKELADLSDETAKSDSRFLKMLGEVAGEVTKLATSLRETVGEEGAPVPGNPASALKAFANRGVEVGAGLEELVQRVDGFARKYPMVTQHPNWATSVQMGPLVTRMDVADVLQQASQSMSKTRLVILGIIDSGDKQQLAQAVTDARRNCAVLEQNAEACKKLLTDLAADLAKMDPGSKAMLDASRGGKLFASQLTTLGDVSKEIEGLPELKLGSVADQLKQENPIVVEANKKIRVVAFSEVWPPRESMAGPSAKGDELARAFNGDSAISSAILALTCEHPFATVVVTSFEPPAPQQRNQFTPPPPQSWVPSSQLTQLRKRLEAANFKVVDWNMATAKEAPKPEEGTKSIYLLLPPPPPQAANPFGQGAPPDQAFGDAQREMIRTILDGDGRALFLATWEVRQGGGFFGGPPTTPVFGYKALLDKDWGIDVDSTRRLVWLEPDRRRDDSFSVIPRLFMHMPAGGFTDQPIGSPLRGTRFLINDSCVLSEKSPLPAGVSVQTVLRIPDKENYRAAQIGELIQIIEKVQDPQAQGVVTMHPPPPRGPFDVTVAAERKDGDKSKGKIVVSAFGASVRDDYLEQPVWAGGEKLRLDPPATENVDLVVNSLYWLGGEEQLISRGVVPVPRVRQIASTDLQVMRFIVWGLWPAVVFAPGIFLWYIRRR